ncbi:Ribosomal protein S18 acetylase RimI [Actinobaculum suis]|uniref:GNAT family N-acetyltransferase n=1 Tax=Actinobaculum suis TaxID=1657 RepID=A0A1G7AT47_9ACTO|nr:GNAT family N-acetyltransferase [Actinobaculum suis]MDY5153435.1 GNAT family N-acetyltransferase [Actinobaculum suis]SDE18048.1 Ribosomal protein S18 acetylase RimI [Actinobaculum suis]
MATVPKPAADNPAENLAPETGVTHEGRSTSEGQATYEGKSAGESHAEREGRATYEGNNAGESHAEREGNTGGVAPARAFRLRRQVAMPADADALTRFDFAVFDREAWPEAAWQEALSFPGCLVLIDRLIETTPPRPEVDDLVAAGAVNLGVEAEIMTIGVDKSFRGQGIGSSLLDSLLTVAAACGAEQVFLEVRENDPVARGLYESRGFYTVGTRPGYYRGTDGLIMRRDIHRDAQ